MYRSTKKYDHNTGLTCCFRQWRARSHCRLLHGYALAFEFVFEAEALDDRNWVIDFGGLDPLKKRLKEVFDHKLVVSQDDPNLDEITMLAQYGIAEVLILDAVGCESFAKYGYELAAQVIKQMEQTPRVRVVSCEVREHGANSAIYCPKLRDLPSHIPLKDQR